jgi:hypothetical protein
VSNDVLTAAGIPDPHAIEYPERHQCAWISETNDSASEVDLLFAAGQPAAAGDPSTDSTATVAGRNTILSTFEQGGTAGCFISANLNPYTETGYQGSFVEIAQLSVKNENGLTSAQACSVGKGVATALWPKLPNPQN